LPRLLTFNSLAAPALAPRTIAQVTSAADVRARLPRDERRAQLLDAARDVFVAQGYHATAMDTIAERAGVSKPVLYRHFPSKLDLYLALLDDGADELVSTVTAALVSTPDNKARVHATVEAYFTFVGDPAGAFRLVFESDLVNDPQVRERLDSVNRQCAERISSVIAADSGLSESEALLLGAGLVGLAQVSARVWLDGDDTLDREEAVRLVAGLSWRGIGGFPRIDETDQ
jgi:AcrR family transcriptional regulator